MPRVNDEAIVLFAFACNLAFAQTDKNKIVQKTQSKSM